MDDGIGKGLMSRWQNESSANLNASANTSKIFGSYNLALSTTTTAAAASASNKPSQKCSSVNFQGKSSGIAFFFVSKPNGIHSMDEVME